MLKRKDSANWENQPTQKKKMVNWMMKVFGLTFLQSLHNIFLSMSLISVEKKKKKGKDAVLAVTKKYNLFLIIPF